MYFYAINMLKSNHFQASSLLSMSIVDYIFWFLVGVNFLVFLSMMTVIISALGCDFTYDNGEWERNKEVN